MEPQEKMTPQQFVVDRLREIQKKVETGNFAEALESLKEVKSADAKNIYIIAIEKQLIKTTDQTVTEKNKSDITNSLPAMFERAVSDAQRRAAATKPPEIKDTKEKEAALEKLKRQYFQRTDDYVAKGDYTHALEEIRRIYIIEPDSVVAKEYEQKIEQLVTLQQKSEEPPPVAPAVKEEAPLPNVAAPQNVETAAPVSEAPKSKMPLIAGAIGLVAVIGVVIFLVLSSMKKPEQPSPSAAPVATAQQQPASQPAAAAPAEVKGNETAKTNEEEKPKQTDTRKPESKPVPAPVQQKVQPEQKQPVAVEQPKQETKQVQAQPQPPPVQQQAAPQQSEPIAAPHPFVAIENPIQVLKLATPEYPEIAYRMGLNGKVVVEVTVDQQGKPIQAIIAKSSSDVFNDASISAAMKSTYKPAMMSTGPVTAKVYVPFTFKIGR